MLRMQSSIVPRLRFVNVHVCVAGFPWTLRPRATSRSFTIGFFLTVLHNPHSPLARRERPPPPPANHFTFLFATCLFG